MTETTTENGVRRNERGELVLSLDALRPKPRWLELPGPDGEPVQVKIPGSLSLETMLELQALEERIRHGKTDAEAIDAIRSFTAILTDIIDRANPNLPDDLRLDLGLQEATRLLVYLAAPSESVAAAFVEAITAGGSEKPDGASDDAHALARAAGIELPGEAKPSAPLRSGKRSSSRSSPSAKSTAGRRSGGSSRAARSKRSASTSATRSGGKKSAKQTG